MHARSYLNINNKILFKIIIISFNVLPPSVILLDTTFRIWPLFYAKSTEACLKTQK